ncbi:MAG TPA: NUDIX hydrolase, partial [Nocardioidaceae bacterium]|nr:NUDIX hydrolase [Nocardioidaceae bacterium]
RIDQLDAGATTFGRDVMEHPGAAAVVALDDDERVLIVRQYRHAAQRRMVEIPAGLLDVDGESPLEAAKRELREEGLTEAASWRPLFTLTPQPGISTEQVHVFLAEQTSESAAPDGFEPEHEEASMTREWVPLADVVDAVLAGRVTNALTVAGSLAVWHLRHG